MESSYDCLVAAGGLGLARHYERWGMIMVDRFGFFGASVAGAAMLWAGGAAAVPVETDISFLGGSPISTISVLQYADVAGVPGLDLNVLAGTFSNGNVVTRDASGSNQDFVTRTTAGGLGVRNNDEGGGSDQSVDGSGNNDILLFSFNQVVRLISVSFTEVDGNDDFSFFFDDDSIAGDGVNQLVYWGVDTDIPDDNSYEFVNIWDRTFFGIGARDTNDNFRVSGLRIAYFVDEDPNDVPTPAGLPLFAAGLLAFGYFSRRRIGGFPAI